MHDANFFAVEFSTNGKFADFTELSAIPKPITPKDLIFRDMAVVALQKLAKLLKREVSLNADTEFDFLMRKLKP